ncbi:MAG: tRNA (N6-isopentenyl adenosine(37)-C2)-methylthiotransferase MiaB [Candidatus Moranbacteria bacterium RBG_19FT_COMBO_42_6]|nr:MAG: tRNA (N6-isopentenyl adenosine(37)-C2)-methylthiotransferase MiaB [Candidatus Moranbacteria bacterium RBG_19FT_COMBO_42_6]
MHKEQQLKYYIKTFGCQMNVSDSERIATVLEDNGLKTAANLNEVDFVIFNTCGVRQMAEDRVYGQVRNVKIQNSKSKIILTGCLSDRKDVQKRLKDKVDLFVPIKNLGVLKNWVIENCFKIKNLKLKISTHGQYLSKGNIDYLSITPRHANKFQAYVPIMTGCNNFCSYCVVPYARGREVSRPAQEIAQEIKNLVKNGYKEIILLGQNVNSYNNGAINFSKLLEKINTIPGDFWIGFISNHPKDVTDEMIEMVARLPKVCESFHLPLQSGNDEIIRKMNRKYTAYQYLNLIEKIKSAYGKHKPEKLFSITSDIIVGFPGETKKQFLASAEMMKKAKYDMVFFGQYSPRPGTAAWKIKDNVSKQEKIRREKYLNEILKKTVYANNKKYIGKTLEVLIESKKGDFYFGKTRTMKNVKIVKVHPVESSQSEDAIGVFNRVKITKASIWNLEGVKTI